MITRMIRSTASRIRGLLEINLPADFEEMLSELSKNYGEIAVWDIYGYLNYAEICDLDPVLVMSIIFLDLGNRSVPGEILRTREYSFYADKFNLTKEVQNG